MKVIAFTGKPYSGKSEAVKIARNLDIPIIRMGDLIWDETKKQGLEINEQNVGEVANNMRENFGMGIWAKKTINKIKNLRNIDLLVIDGVRNIEEIEIFKNNLGEDFTIIAIEASDNTRYSRAMTRNRIDDSRNIENIKERDKREIRWGLNSIIAFADIVISNDADLRQFKNKINEIFEKYTNITKR
jgi:dephospho-CoA kinase